jgi:hypothetical protein
LAEAKEENVSTIFRRLRDISANVIFEVSFKSGGSLPHTYRRFREQDGSLSLLRLERVRGEKGRAWLWAGIKDWSPEMDKKVYYVMVDFVPVTNQQICQTCFHFVKVLLRRCGFSLQNSPSDRILGQWAKEMGVSLDDVKYAVTTGLSSMGRDDALAREREAYQQGDARLAATAV